MKRKLNNLLYILLLFSVFISCKNNKDNELSKNSQSQLNKMVYSCPMHPEVVSDKPGVCPKCNMDLELIQKEIMPQVISPNKQVISNQATVKLHLAKEGDRVKEQGYITLAQNRNVSVAARFSGRIEKMYVTFDNQLVSQGAKIMDIYSPTLQTYQEEHLFLLKSKTETKLLEKSREKLRLLGISKEQIKQLEKDGKFILSISVFSPSNGYVFFSKQTMNENMNSKKAMPMDGMSMSQNKNKASSFVSSTTQIREGDYINEGQTLFSVNDLKEVWALVSIANQNINQIHEKQKVEIVPENISKKIFSAQVNLIEQTFEDANQRFERIRIILPNEDKALKINSLVVAQFTLSVAKNLMVPTSSVFKTGLNAYVWVKTDTTEKGAGIFKLRRVIAGTSNNGMINITSGLLADEEIAKEAGLMVDSETYLNEN